MKSIIESSLYLYLMAFICFISVQFILMNEKVTKVNEVSTYIENYIEAKGICQTRINNINEKEIIYYKYNDQGGLEEATQEEINNKSILTFPKLSLDLEKTLTEVINDYGFNISFKYTDVTNDYVYIEYKITYNLSHSILGFSKTHTYTGLARFSLIG